MLPSRESTLKIRLRLLRGFDEFIGIKSSGGATILEGVQQRQLVIYP
jgi:hypothetical protein